MGAEARAAEALAAARAEHDATLARHLSFMVRRHSMWRHAVLPPPPPKILTAAHMPPVLLALGQSMLIGPLPAEMHPHLPCCCVPAQLRGRWLPQLLQPAFCGCTCEQVGQQWHDVRRRVDTKGMSTCSAGRACKAECVLLHTYGHDLIQARPFVTDM